MERQMKTYTLMLALAFAIGFTLVMAAGAAVFHINKPSCTTQCVTVNGVTTCRTVCSGGYN
jgi:hypothetical protein